MDGIELEQTTRRRTFSRFFNDCSPIKILIAALVGLIFLGGIVALGLIPVYLNAGSSSSSTTSNTTRNYDGELSNLDMTGLVQIPIQNDVTGNNLVEALNTARALTTLEKAQIKANLIANLTIDITASFKLAYPNYFENLTIYNVIIIDDTRANTNSAKIPGTTTTVQEVVKNVTTEVKVTLRLAQQLGLDGNDVVQVTDIVVKSTICFYTSIQNQAELVEDCRNCTYKLSNPNVCEESLTTSTQTNSITTASTTYVTTTTTQSFITSTITSTSTTTTTENFTNQDETTDVTMLFE